MVQLSTKVLDGVLDGFSNMRLAHITSDDPEPIIRAVLYKLNRRATILEGRGAYTRHERQLVPVTISQREISQLKEIVAEVDPEAFISIGNAAEVLGHGFKQPPTRARR